MTSKPVSIAPSSWVEYSLWNGSSWGHVLDRKRSRQIGDRAGVERTAEQGRDHRHARARAEHRREQRARLGLKPVQVKDERHKQRDRQQREEQSDKRRRGAALHHDDREGNDRDQATGGEHEKEQHGRPAEPRGIEHWPTRPGGHIKSVTGPIRTD